METIEYLPKKGGARFTERATYKVHCLQKAITGIESLKADDEVIDEFVHVLRGHLDKFPNVPVIIKVQEADHKFARQEVKAMRALEKCVYAAEMLCEFACPSLMHDWMKSISKPVGLCKHMNHATQNQVLGYLVMEYVDAPDLSGFLMADERGQEAKMLKSIMMQMALIIGIFAFDYKLFHGDLHCGNIFITSTAQKYMQVCVDGQTYRVKTYGFMPKFIDFGRGGFRERIANADVVEDGLTILSLVSNYIRDVEYKTKVREFINVWCSQRRPKFRDFMSAMAVEL
jgi:serine/threonine protein kinase